MDNRPQATYRSDVRDTVGQVVGPTLYGEYLVVDEVTYDATEGRSLVKFRNATTQDVEAQR
jgi:hypothetical protein